MRVVKCPKIAELKKMAGSTKNTIVSFLCCLENSEGSNMLSIH